MSEMTNKETLPKAIKRTRKEILDLLEVAFGQSTKWPLVRSRMLAAFGRYGLERFTIEEKDNESATELQKPDDL